MDEIKIFGGFAIEAIANNSNPELFSKGGVYLWTLEHQNKLSIVYVGETDNFSIKFRDHRNKFRIGKQYFLIPNQNEDVYSILRTKDFGSLIEAKKFWEPDYSEPIRMGDN